MGAYIGSVIGKLGGSYLDEREAQAEKRRREMEEAQATGERRSQFNRLLSADQFQRDKYATEQSEALRERQQKEADRKEFPARFKAAQAGDQEAMGWVLERYPQMASALTRPDPRVKTRASATFTIDGKTPMMGSFDQEEGAYYDARGNRVENAQPWQKPEGMTEYQRRSLALRERRGGKALPSSIVEKLGAYDALDQMGEEVAAALKNAIASRQDITGRAAGVIKTPTWWKNAAPTVLGGKPAISDGSEGDVGVDTRAMLGNLYATLAKERGGTALSANEIRLLESYLPNENEDESRAFLKATRFVKELRRLKAAKLASFQKYGYSVDDSQPLGDALSDLWEK